MNRRHLKRRISPYKSLGTEDDFEGGVEDKKFRHLTGIQITDHDVITDKVYMLAADEYERYLVQENSVATSFAPHVKSDTAADANPKTCGSPLQSSRKLRHDLKSSLQLQKPGEQDDTNALQNGTSQLSPINLDLGISELLAVPLVVTEQQRTYDGCTVDEFCQICKKDISCCNEQQRQQHTNQCIDELENAEQEKELLEGAAKILCIQQVLNCPICSKKLRTLNARHLHLKKCAARFCISAMDLIELIKEQEQNRKIQVLSSSFQERIEELAETEGMPAEAKKKKKRAVKIRFEEPHNKLEEDTQLAIALSTSIEERRNSVLDFISYTLPLVNQSNEEEEEEEEERVAESHPLTDATINPLSRSSKDAFLLLMSQKTKESSLSTICGKKNNVAKQSSALLALDQDDVKRRLAEKATTLVLEQPDIGVFYDADVPCFPESKMSAKYCHKRSKDFLWCLATQNTEKLFDYYVKELVHPIVPRDYVGCSLLQQKRFNWQMSDERPEKSLLDPAMTSVIYGSTQTALILAELAAEAGTEASFADDFSQKSLCNYQEMLKQPSPSIAVAKGFYLATDKVCDKACNDLLNAWSQMVDNGCMSDLTVNCRDGEVIRLHRLVIMARYPNLLPIIDSQSSTKVFSQFSKMAALSIVRFIYSADTDVSHAVVFEAKRLAESLELTDYCKICEDLVKTYNLIEQPTVAREASAAKSVEELVSSWNSSDVSNLMQRDNLNDSCVFSGQVMEKEEEEVEDDGDWDEVYSFMLTQRRKQMKRGGLTSEDKDNESDTSSKMSLKDEDDSLIKTWSQSCSRSDDEGSPDVLLLELSDAASFRDKLSTVVSSGKSDEAIIGRTLCDSAQTSEECVPFGCKMFPEKILSVKKECGSSSSSSVHVESSDGKVQQHSDSVLIDSVSKNSNRTIDLIAMENEADRVLSEDDDDDDDDKKNVLPQKHSEEFSPIYTTGVKLCYGGNDKSREASCQVGGSCVSFDNLRTDPIINEHPLDSADVYAVDSFDTSQRKEKERVVLSTLKSVSVDDDLVSTCSVVSNDNSLSPDLFPSSPCSQTHSLSSGFSLQEPCVLLQAAEKLKNVLYADVVFSDMLETSESMIDYRSNLSTGRRSARHNERQNEAECEKYGHTVPSFKKISATSIYQKSISETHCHSQDRSYSSRKEKRFDAKHQFLSQMGEKLMNENFLPDLDDDDDHVKVQNRGETTDVQSLTSGFNCTGTHVRNSHMTNNSNEIENKMCCNEMLFPRGMRTLNLLSDVEIDTTTTKMNESFRNHLPSKSSSSSCGINSSVVTDKVDHGCQLSSDRTSEEIQNIGMRDEEYYEKSSCGSLGDVADCDVAIDDVDDCDDKNANQHISIQCDDDVSAALLNSDGRIYDEESVWKKFPEEEEEFVSHVSFENETNTSHMWLTSITPKSVKGQQGQSSPGALINYSPPTDLETDVSALMEDVIANSSLLNSDVSFEMSNGPARTLMDAGLPVINTVKHINCSEFTGSPVTPLPSYRQMNTPALQQRCHGYGVRRLPKKQMVGVLENIFFELHPDFPKPDIVKPKQNANRKTKAVTKTGNLASFLTIKEVDANIPPKQDNWSIPMIDHSATAMSSGLCQQRSFVAKRTTAEILECTDNESDNYLELECPRQDFGNDDEVDEEYSLLEYDADERVLVQNEKKKKSVLQSKQDDFQKKQILTSFFSKSTDLYQRILNYEPLELDYLKKLLKENEIKVTSQFLIDFLDEQNILFTTRSNRAACSSHRLPAKRKVISRPPSQKNVFSIG